MTDPQVQASTLPSGFEAGVAPQPHVEAFHDPRTGSVQYVVSDPATRQCAIIDPVLDYDENSGRVRTTHADRLLAHVSQNGLAVEWILDTHPHADHFSASAYLRDATGAPTAIGANVVGVQKIWRELYNLPSLKADGSQWDRLFSHGERFRIGTLEATVLDSPGHTMASISYLVGDAAFIHDTLFMPDSGTARADFPGADARTLWRSIQAILSLPDNTRLFVGHDYQPGGRAAAWQSSVAEQKEKNPHILRQDEASYVALRQTRDRSLPIPRLMLHALQVNLNGGRLPEPEENGRRYLKIPLDTLGDRAWG